GLPRIPDRTGREDGQDLVRRSKRQLGTYAQKTGPERVPACSLRDPAMKRILGALTLFALPMLAGSAVAHHALQSEFDINGPSHRWTGTLKSVQWINPHSHFLIDVA